MQSLSSEQKSIAKDILEDILSAIERLEERTSNDKTTNGLLLPTYPDIPWKNVKGLRDIIAHHYFDVDAAQILWISPRTEGKDTN